MDTLRPMLDQAEQELAAETDPSHNKIKLHEQKMTHEVRKGESGE